MIIDDDDRLMMSQELFGIIPDFEDQIKDNKAIVSYKIFGIDEQFVFYLNSCSVGNVFFIEYFCDIESSLKITKNYNEVAIEEFKLIYNNITSSFDGQFKIGNVTLNMKSPKNEFCLLRLDLIKNT